MNLILLAAVAVSRDARSAARGARTQDLKADTEVRFQVGR